MKFSAIKYNSYLLQHWTAWEPEQQAEPSKLELSTVLNIQRRWEADCKRQKQVSAVKRQVKVCVIKCLIHVLPFAQYAYNFWNMQNGRHLKAYLLAKYLLYPISISQGFSIQGNVWGGSLTLRASCLTRNNFCFVGDVGFWTKPRVHTGCQQATKGPL